MSVDILTVEDLVVHRGQSKVLHGVDLAVRQGGVTALLGRNGVGKTSTLRGLLGLETRSGRIVLDGKDISRLPTHEIVRHGIGYVPEDREVFAGLTVAENLRLAARPGGPHHYTLVYELFPRLAERRRQAAGTMSGGEQQMLALARALLNDNRLLLIDEPSQGLAPHLVTELADALAKVAELWTILLVEQNLTLVRRLATQAVVLDQGQVVWNGDIDALLDDPALTRRHLGVGVSTT